jgi:hypothetical protein
VVSWGSIAVTVGRPRHDGIVCARAMIPVNYAAKVDQVRDAHGVYSEIAGHHHQPQIDAQYLAGSGRLYDGQADPREQLWPKDGRWCVDLNGILVLVHELTPRLRRRVTGR